MQPTCVSVTIDVENPQTPLFEKRFNDNRIWSDGWGLQKIIETLDAAGAVGDFFVNVYEAPVWGPAEMERVVKTIHDAGHCVHLHTHPIWLDEKRRENMYQLPLHEQRGFIEWGSEFIERCIGRRPAVHRAGAYGINADTLRACRETGILVDSSSYPGHPNCRHSFPANVIVVEDGLVELPVTVFNRKKGMVVKTDIDAMLPGEFEQFLEHAVCEQRMWFVNLFMHSYSLTRTADGFATCRPDPTTANRLRDTLERVREHPSCELATLENVAKRALPSLKVAVDTPVGADVDPPTRVEVARPRRLRVALSKGFPKVRIHKIAKALRATGRYELTLLARRQDSQLFEPWFDHIRMVDGSDLARTSADLDVDLMHVAPPKNDWPEAIMRSARCPVIYDAMDYAGISDSIEALPDNERRAERYCLENADGLIHKGPAFELDYYRRHGYRIEAPQQQWLDWCDEDRFADRTVEKLSDRDGEIHVVYAGAISADPDSGNTYIYYVPLARRFAAQGVHLHLYSNPYQVPDCQPYVDLERECPYFHIETPVRYTELSGELAKYDWGMWVHPVHGRLDVRRCSATKCKVAIGNKLFSYMEAGIPTLVSRHLEYGSEFITGHGVGTAVADDELDRVGEILRSQDTNGLAERIREVRAELCLRKQIPQLEDFYRRVMERSGRLAPSSLAATA
jgi:peptidoglycan/xylan/chitin deacetylase (PgdA/CDA1 family)